MACHRADIVGGTCDLVRLSIPNCMLTTLDQDTGVSTCAVCEKGYAFDPFGQKGDLCGRDGLVLLGRRHDLVGIFADNALQKGALLGMPRHDRRPVVPPLDGGLARVEPQPPLRLRRPMA